MNFVCFRAAQTGKHLLCTQNVSEQNQKHLFCPGYFSGPQQMLEAQANGETFVPATMCLRWPGPLGLACAIHQCASVTIFTKNEARKTEKHESMKNGNGFVSK